MGLDTSHRHLNAPHNLADPSSDEGAPGPVFVVGCIVDLENPETSSEEQAIDSQNKLATNKLATNKLAANKLATNALAAASVASGTTGATLINTADGRQVLTYIVSCALSASQSITLKDSANTPYTFTGSLGLGSASLTRWSDGIRVRRLVQHDEPDLCESERHRLDHDVRFHVHGELLQRRERRVHGSGQRRHGDLVVPDREPGHLAGVRVSASHHGLRTVTDRIALVTTRPGDLVDWITMDVSSTGEIPLQYAAGVEKVRDNTAMTEGEAAVQMIQQSGLPEIGSNGEGSHINTYA